MSWLSLFLISELCTAHTRVLDEPHLQRTTPNTRPDELNQTVAAPHALPAVLAVQAEARPCPAIRLAPPAAVARQDHAG